MNTDHVSRPVTFLPRSHTTQLQLLSNSVSDLLLHLPPRLKSKLLSRQSSIHIQRLPRNRLSLEPSTWELLLRKRQCLLPRSILRRQ